MADETLQEILDSLPKINASRNYWFFRTHGGDYYDDFLKGNYIAIGYDKITLADIKAGNTGDVVGLTILANKISDTYKKDEYRPSYAASQLLKFAYTIKKDDIVLIPSISSSEISFGKIVETPAYLDNPKNEDDCPYTKRKRVKWLKTISRDDLDANLYKLMFSHHTISDANSYADYIDKITNSFFIKKDKAYLVLNVTTTDNIKAIDLFGVGYLSMQLLDDFCKEEDLNYDTKDFEVKLAVQSPGFIELSGVSMGGIILLGMIIVGLAGGGFHWSNKGGTKTGLKTDGIIEKMKRFLTSRDNSKMKKKLLEKHMEDLKIEDPADLIKVLKELDK